MSEYKRVPFPYEFKELEPEEKLELCRVYQATEVDERFDFVSVGPKRYKQLRTYCEDAANIYNLPLRASDVFVVTYPRSGTTLTQELVWLISNDFDYTTAKAKTTVQRCPHIDMFTTFGKKWQEKFLEDAEDKVESKKLADRLMMLSSEKLAMAPSPRLIKSHMPLSLLPPTLLHTSKVVYVARDPRDVAVSFFHLIRLFKAMSYTGSFKDFWSIFIKDLANFTPIFEHVKEAWRLRHNPNMLFLFYEDIIKDQPAAVRRVADFLGKEVTVEQMAKLCDYLNIENFRKNESVNLNYLRPLGVLTPNENFIRKGKAGGWRDYFDEEMTQQADEWFKKNLLDTDLRYPY